LRRDCLDSGRQWNGKDCRTLFSFVVNYPSEKLKIVLHAIAAHLIHGKGGEAAIVDTAGTFSPVRLRDIIAYRLSLDHRKGNHECCETSNRDAAQAIHSTKEAFLDQAARLLDRVKFMRVFDLAGAAEAVAEISQSWDSQIRSPTVEKSMVRHEVASSQGDEVEELESSNPPGRQSQDGVGMLVVDNIANVVGVEMSKNQIRGHALLVTLQRSLRNLATGHKICILLVNSAVNVDPLTEARYSRKLDDHASVFASTWGKPALGRTYASLIDLSIYLSTMPKTREGAEVAQTQSFQKTTKSRSVGIFEVLKDRTGMREGRWCVFDICDGIKLLPIE